MCCKLFLIVSTRSGEEGIGDGWQCSNVYVVFKLVYTDVAFVNFTRLIRPRKKNGETMGTYNA